MIKLPITTAVILNIDPYDLESKLNKMGAELAYSTVVSLQRFDIQKGSHFLVPIYKSERFHTLFEEIARKTSNGETLHRQGIYLIVKRESLQNFVILKNDCGLNIKLAMSLDQSKSMSKVLKAGGMKKVAIFKKTTMCYKLSRLRLNYKIYVLSHMMSFLEVKGDKEDFILEGLAAMGIAINRALINTNFNKVLSKFQKTPNCDLLEFLL